MGPKAVFLNSAMDLGWPAGCGGIDGPSLRSGKRNLLSFSSLSLMSVCAGNCTLL